MAGNEAACRLRQIMKAESWAGGWLQFMINISQRVFHDSRFCEMATGVPPKTDPKIT